MANRQTRIAINGLGRIGRAFLRASRHYPKLSIVAVNDIGERDTLAYLLRHDSVYGKAPFDVEVTRSGFRIAGAEIAHTSVREPEELAWGEMDIDVVVESTGVFESFAKASAHLTAGAKRVVVSAPVKDVPPSGTEGATVLMGVNEEKLNTCLITSNASCTTNAASPLMAILEEGLGIENALLSTVHGYTASQSLVDAPAQGDVRRGRAAAQNIVPSSTGAAISTTKALPALEGHFDGIAIRVPVICGSLVDITLTPKRETTREEVNSILKDAAESERWQGIFAVTEEPLVSSDIVGEAYGAIADLAMTRVVGGKLVKVLAWYDNEMGYAHTLARHVEKLGMSIK